MDFNKNPCCLTSSGASISKTCLHAANLGDLRWFQHSHASLFLLYYIYLTYITLSPNCCIINFFPCDWVNSLFSASVALYLSRILLCPPRSSWKYSISWFYFSLFFCFLQLQRYIKMFLKVWCIFPKVYIFKWDVLLLFS